MQYFEMRLFRAALAAVLCGLFLTPASAVTFNHAIDGIASASNSYLTFTPDLAIDGNTGTFWNAGGVPPAYIEIDLGSVKRIDGINAFVIQSPAGATNHDVYLDGALTHSWSGATSDGNWLSHSFLAPVFAQIVRIQTTLSPSWVAWGEIEVYRTLPIPLPAGLPLLLAGLGVFGFMRSRRTLA